MKLQRSQKVKTQVNIEKGEKDFSGVVVAYVSMCVSNTVVKMWETTKMNFEEEESARAKKYAAANERRNQDAIFEMMLDLPVLASRF